MKKVFCSCLLSVTMILSSVSFAYASDSKKDFYDAFEVTQNTLNNEFKVLEASDLSTKIYKQLIEEAYQTNFNLGVNQIISFEDSDLSRLFFNSDSRYLENGTGVISDYSISIPSFILNSTKDFKIDFNFYFLDNKLGIKIPQLFDEYYYVDLSTFVNDYLKSDLNELAPLDETTMAVLESYQNAFKNMNDPQIILDKAEAAGNSIIDFVGKYKDRAFYTNDGKSIIDSKRGQIVTTKLSLNINENIANEFFIDFADFFEKDQAIYDYYKLIYGSIEIEGQDFTRMMLSSIAESLKTLKAIDTTKFSVYTNESNHIYRYEFDTNLEVEGTDMPFNINLVFDTKGKNYLLNEIYIDAAITESGDTLGFTFESYGNIVPKDNVSNYKFDFAMMSGGVSSDFTITKLGSGDYYYNASQKTDNYKLNLEILPSYMFGDDSLKFSLLGDVENDIQNKSLRFDLKNIKVTYGEELLIDFFAKISMNPYDKDKITIPPTAIKLTDLKTEQLSNLLESINSKLQNIM